MKVLTFKAALGVFVMAGATALAAPAGAMPVLNGAAVAQAQGSNVEKTRWVCGPYRCWWQPGYGYFGRPHYWGGYYGRPHYWGGYRPHHWGGYRPHYWGGYGHHWRHW